MEESNPPPNSESSLLKQSESIPDNASHEPLSTEQKDGEQVINNEKDVQKHKNNDAFVFARIPLCPDYGTDSSASEVDTESVDSEPDSSSGSDEEETSSSTDCEKLEEIIKPVEELKISVAKEEAEEMGTVKSIVDNQVIVEPRVGIAALDLDTILFLNNGEEALGKVYDVFGPIAEPLYIILLPSQSFAKKKNIQAGTKVYFAPKTSHTSYVQLSELMRMKGSDASWKHNVEVPPEEQDFSDDEEERKAKNVQNGKATPKRPHNNNSSASSSQHKNYPPKHTHRNPFSPKQPRFKFYRPPQPPNPFPSRPPGFTPYSFTVPPPTGGCPFSIPPPPPLWGPSPFAVPPPPQVFQGPPQQQQPMFGSQPYFNNMPLMFSSPPPHPPPPPPSNTQ